MGAIGDEIHVQEAVLVLLMFLLGICYHHASCDD